jgi:hypothetical protein
MATDIRLIRNTSELEHTAYFDSNRHKLISLIEDVTDWVKHTLNEHESIAVLGM